LSIIFRKRSSPRGSLGEFPEWSVDKIDGKTGIREGISPLRTNALPTWPWRRCGSSSLPAHASRCGGLSPLLHAESRLLFAHHCVSHTGPPGIPRTAGALDFNLGCSGFIYGLGLAQGLVVSGQASNVLLLTAETYSKFLSPRDRSVRTIFGDAAAATLLTAEDSPNALIGPFAYGTDGSGGRT